MRQTERYVFINFWILQNLLHICKCVHFCISFQNQSTQSNRKRLLSCNICFQIITDIARNDYLLFTYLLFTCYVHQVAKQKFYPAFQFAIIINEWVRYIVSWAKMFSSFLNKTCQNKYDTGYLRSGWYPVSWAAHTISEINTFYFNFIFKLSVSYNFNLNIMLVIK